MQWQEWLSYASGKERNWFELKQSTSRGHKTVNRRKFGGLLLVLASWELVSVPRIAESAAVPCINATECEIAVGFGSICRPEAGSCSNPFEQGCLLQMLPGWKKKRVCNSDDPPNAAELGICRIPSFDYPEVRPVSLNWESTFFEVWILQIVLSEMVDVPVTIESGQPHLQLNFYDPDGLVDYAMGDDMATIRLGSELKDCRLASRDPDNYESCGHVITEVWNIDQEKYRSLMREDVAEASGLGAMGREGWFIPKFAAEQDPSLTHFLGLVGEENRRKLAETFLRPTAWGDYCELVSLDNCTTDDGVAVRAPQDETESVRMFVPGLFIGHFRKTEENDCDTHPTICTGHIADFPCVWSSFVEQKLHHLNIALRSSGSEDYSGGYPYPRLPEMWLAANATKSPLMAMWWTPEAVYQSFLGTEIEMQRVALPPPTQACLDARTDETAQCAEDLATRVGSSVGACDYEPLALQKFIGTGLRDLVNDPAIPEPARSAAYEVVRRFRLSGVQLGRMFEYWQSKRTKREAICQWVAENIEFVQEFVPNSYPRVLQEGIASAALYYVAISVGSLATALVLCTAALVYRQRHRRVMVFSQIEFLWLLLAGLLAIAIGAIMLAIPPQDGRCIIGAWLVSVGYSLEIVPLLVKVAAINRLTAAAKKMRRVVLRRRSLFGGVVLILAMVLAFMACWTALDPPRLESEYALTSRKTDDGEWIVLSQKFCSVGESRIWSLAAVGWNAVLLVCASVLAFQSRNVKQAFNESKTLGFMIYSHFIFVVLRIITLFLSGRDGISESILSRCRSLIFSSDAIATLALYFAPKFNAPDDAARIAELHRDASSQSGLRIDSQRRGSIDQGSVSLSFDHILVQEGKKASRRLLNNLRRLQDHLTEVDTDAPVVQEDWDTLRSLVGSTANTLENQVIFDWDDCESDSSPKSAKIISGQEGRKPVVTKLLPESSSRAGLNGAAGVGEGGATGKDNRNAKQYTTRSILGDRMVSIISLTSEQDRTAANQFPVTPEEDEATDKADSASLDFEASSNDCVVRPPPSGDQDEDALTELAQSLSDIYSEDAAEFIGGASSYSARTCSA